MASPYFLRIGVDADPFIFGLNYCVAALHDCGALTDPGPTRVFTRRFLAGTVGPIRVMDALPKLASVLGRSRWHPRVIATWIQSQIDMTFGIE